MEFFIAEIGLFLFFMLLAMKIWVKNKVNRNELHQVLADHDREIQDQVQEPSSQTTDLEQKDAQIESQALQISTLQKENELLQAKYYAKLKAAETKKKNLAAYYAKQEEIRKNKSIEDQAIDIVGKGPKWLSHSITGPKSNKIGKPKGSYGAGCPCPVKIHGTIEFHVHKCTHCGADLKDLPEFFGIRQQLQKCIASKKMHSITSA